MSLCHDQVILIDWVYAEFKQFLSSLECVSINLFRVQIRVHECLCFKFEYDKEERVRVGSDGRN